jgi:predicted transcriptional regulator of viral defense system
MDVYRELATYPVFSIDEVTRLTRNLKTSYSAMSRLMRKGLVKKIRKELYSPVNPTTGHIVASRFQIACAINQTAYLSHYSALEYYGLTNQVFNEVYVSSDIKFHYFDFEQTRYKFVQSKTREGIIQAKHTTGVFITDLERSIIDTMKDFDKIGGLEALMYALENIPFLDEKKLIDYLDLYHVQALYQKVGFLLERYRKEMQVSDGFFEYCQSKIGKSVRYLTSDKDADSVYHKKWKLMVPKNLFEMLSQGEDINA